MPPLVLAAVSEQKTISATLRIGDSIVFQLDGLLVVFIALGLIWAAITVLGIYFKRAAIAAAAASAASAVKTAATAAAVARPAPVVPLTEVVPAAPMPPAAAALPADSAPALTPDLSPELVAVIAAAVQLTLRDAYRIHAIVPVAGHDWAHEGRRQIFASHQIR
jgi:hypothetical protein